MLRPVLSVLVAVTLLGSGACYQDDSTTGNGRPVAQVLLTDAPFPYDSVQHVNIYVDRIEANSSPDTSGGGAWVLIAQPRQVFDLLTLQQGGTAFLGQRELAAGQYSSIRMVIRADLSAILWSDGSAAHIQWPSPNTGEIALYALVEAPLAVSSSGAVIVIDFDVGRSFLYNYYGTKEFTLVPWLRAVNSAATGTLEGTVTSSSTGQSQVIPNANVTLYVGDPSAPASTWYVAVTGRSDANGHYKVAFVRAGTYIARVEQPDYPALAPSITPAVVITAGNTTTLPVTLTKAGGGGAYVHITGPTTVGVGGSIVLFAAVGDNNGNPVPNPSVSWTSRNPAVATVSGFGDTASVTGRQSGSATIVATSGSLSDSITIQVTGAPGSVASVAVQPSTASLAVGDTMSFSAVLRDSAGNILTGRPVSWFSTDSAFAIVNNFGGSIVGRGQRAGSALLQATSQGKTGQATITVR
jgi:Domain of unknown function (DUF4382)/Carboxypeptidase regulatory-like domain/Bacterial Ig-like domain (group 2)